MSLKRVKAVVPTHDAKHSHSASSTSDPGPPHVLCAHPTIHACWHVTSSHCAGFSPRITTAFGSPLSVASRLRHAGTHREWDDEFAHYAGKRTSCSAHLPALHSLRVTCVSLPCCCSLLSIQMIALLNFFPNIFL